MHRPSHYLDIPFVDLCSWVFDAPSYDIDKPIYVEAHDESQTLSYRQSLAHVRRVIAGLKARGLQPGDSVCVHSFNTIWYSILFLAAIGARGRFVGSNPAYTTHELTHLFTITKTRFVIVESEQLERVLPAVDACSIPHANVLLFDTAAPAPDARFDSWRALLEHGESDWHRFDDEHEAKHTPAMLASTSGTTGLPKAATMPHHTFVAMSKQSYDSGNKPYEVRRLLCLAQFHIFPVPLFHVAPLKEGHTTYIMRRWDLARYVDCIDRFQITETALVTPIVLALLGLPAAEQRRLRSLRSLVAAGAPLGPSDQNALRQRCHPDATFTQVWGLTECGWITNLLYPEDDHTGSVGRLMPCNEAKIIDEDGNELTADDARGEIVVRGPGLMMGYLDNPDATRAAIIDGWFHTGDVGYQREGKWYVVDRVKELIKVRGWQVSPSEVEQCLLAHPDILDAAVLGVDFGDGQGERPRAYIVPAAPDRCVTDEQLTAFLGQRLAKYKALTGGIVRISAIPRNPSGKILRRILRDRAAQELAGAAAGSDSAALEAVNSFAVSSSAPPSAAPPEPAAAEAPTASPVEAVLQSLLAAIEDLKGQMSSLTHQLAAVHDEVRTVAAGVGALHLVAPPRPRTPPSEAEFDGAPAAAPGHAPTAVDAKIHVHPTPVIIHEA